MGLERVFLCDSGSIAVEVAIKIAFQYWLSLGKPERNRLLTVRGGYHGDTFATMAICDPVNGMHDFFSGVLPSHYFAERPSCRFDEDFEEVVRLLEPVVRWRRMNMLFHDGCRLQLAEARIRLSQPQAALEELQRIRPNGHSIDRER